jgi:hypothetical protein
LRSRLVAPSRFSFRAQAQLAQYNYILVVGDSEVAGNTVNVRTRDGKVSRFALFCVLR